MKPHKRISILVQHLLGENGSTVPLPSHELNISDCHFEERDYCHTKLNAETLHKERAAAKFNVREMIYLLEGGKEMTEVCSCPSSSQHMECSL
jgi:hypothetical protein